MAFRGRGRGRGGRGRGGFYDTRLATKHEEFILFPDDVNLPCLPNVESLSNEEKELVKWKVRLEYFWKGSCYHLEQAPKKSKKQDVEIERFSDKFKQKTQARREALASYLKLTPANFPTELIQGSKRVQHDHKKLRWDRDSDEKMLDMLEKLEEQYKGQDEKDAKERNAEDEDEEVEEEVEEESSDDGDYNQNVDFDDDEDDLNMEEEDDEDVYE